MVPKQVTLDSDILVCAFDANEGVRREQALMLLEWAGRNGCKLGVQVIGEFYDTTVARGILNPVRAYDEIELLIRAFDTFAPTPLALQMAGRQVAKGLFKFRDALVIASAYHASCALLLSGTIEHGVGFASTTTCNPFGARGLSNAVNEALGM